MDEKKLIEKLLSKETDARMLKLTLKKIADFMEETYILNLPPSKTLLSGLRSYAKNPQATSPEKAEAKRLIKSYSLK